MKTYILLTIEHEKLIEDLADKIANRASTIQSVTKSDGRVVGANAELLLSVPETQRRAYFRTATLVPAVVDLQSDAPLPVTMCEVDGPCEGCQ